MSEREHERGDEHRVTPLELFFDLAFVLASLDDFSLPTTDDVPQRSVCHRALGRVALWGTVVEGDIGWRASRAYPRTIYLPSEGTKPRAGLDAIVKGLSVYGVRVEVRNARARALFTK